MAWRITNLCWFFFLNEYFSEEDNLSLVLFHGCPRHHLVLPGSSLSREKIWIFLFCETQSTQLTRGNIRLVTVPYSGPLKSRFGDSRLPDWWSLTSVKPIHQESSGKGKVHDPISLTRCLFSESERTIFVYFPNYFLFV